MFRPKRELIASLLRYRSFSSLAHDAPAYVKGPSQPPLINETMGGLLRQVASTQGDSLAVASMHQEARLTYKELLQKAEQVSQGLIALDIHRGDRVAITLPNCLEWIILQYATAMIGSIAVAVNPDYKAMELIRALNVTNAKLLVIGQPEGPGHHPDALDYLEEVLEETPSIHYTVMIGNTHRPKGVLHWSDLEGASRGGGGKLADMMMDRYKKTGPKDAASIQFTSGTTGFPKGAVLSHYNIINNGYQLGHIMRLTPADKICVPVPLFHCFGQVMGNLAAANHGASVIYPAPFFKAAPTLEAVHKERCTALYGVPTMFIRELDLPNFAEYDLSSLRTGIMAGSPCPEQLMKRVRGEMHMKEFTICYGQTETSPISFQTAIDDPEERIVTTVGRVHPHVEAKVIDPQADTPSVDTLPLGTVGELCTRGYGTMIGYWENPEATAKTVDHATGWLRTGDLAVLDTEGYCAIVGRCKDIVIRGGENIPVREVEELLHQHPDVAEAQVFGVPDELLGEEICAWVVLKTGVDEVPSGEELKAWCKGRLARFKVPRYVAFKAHGEIPMTASGKPQKYKMRAMAAKDLGLAEET